MDNCPKCGVDRDVWGRLHNCRSKRVENVVAALPVERREKIESRSAELSATYKYRNKEKRRAQVAAAMRLYRARLKEKRNVKKLHPEGDQATGGAA